MFQFRRFPSYTYFIQYMIAEVCSAGLLHSEISGSMCTYHSPELIAVNHVLLRLPMPRHSPCALFSFTICFIIIWVLMIVNHYFVVLPNNYFLKINCRLILVVSSFALLLLYSIFKLLLLFLRTDFNNQSLDYWNPYLGFSQCFL